MGGRQKKGETLSDEQMGKMKSRSQVEAEIIDLDNGGNGQVRKAQEPDPASVAAAVKNGQTQERSDAKAPSPAAKVATTPAPAAQPAAAEPPAESADPAKRKKAIVKKLKQIEDLEAKVKKGESLDGDQQAKLDSKAALLKEMATL